MGGIAPYEAQIPHLARSSRGSNWRCFTIFFHVCASSSRYRSPQSTLYVMLRCTMGCYPPPPQMIWKKEEKYKGPLNAMCWLRTPAAFAGRGERMGPWPSGISVLSSKSFLFIGRWPGARSSVVWGRECMYVENWEG